MTVSMELGYNATMADDGNVKYVLQPHAQVVYQNVRADSFRESNGSYIDFLNHSRTQMAIGLRAAAPLTTGMTSVITPHIEANWLHSSRGYAVRMNGTVAELNSGRDIGQLKLGIGGELGRRASLSLELFRNQGTAGYRETGGNLTMKYQY